MTLSIRLASFMRVALGSALLVASSAALAQSAVRGKQLYESRINPNYLSCSDAGTCHGGDPLLNVRKVRNGTNPQAIVNAINSVPLMNPLRGLVSSTDAADLAAYISNPGASTTLSLAASAASMTFGATQVASSNGNPAPTAVTITNTGTAAVTITGITASGTNGPDFLPVGTCVSASPLTLAVGATCTLGATFTPSASGTRTATLTIQSGAPTNPSIALSGTGSAVAVATITLSRTSVAFATQTVATTSTAQDVVIRNTGTAGLTITQIDATPSAEFASSSNCVTTILPGGSCTVVLVFTPAAAGTRSGSLSLLTNTGTSTVPLTGYSVLVPTPIATPARAAVAMPPVVVGTATPPSVTVSLANTGNAPLEITSVSLRGPDAGEFKLGEATTCKPGTMAPLAECVAEVAFVPQSGGGKTVSIAVAHTASGGTTIIPVTATATAAAKSLGSSALFPSNVGGGGSLSPAQHPLLVLVLLLVGRARRRTGSRSD